MMDALVLRHVHFEDLGAFAAPLRAAGYAARYDDVGEPGFCAGDPLEPDLLVVLGGPVGTARLEVSQGRQPCWKLNERFGSPQMARHVQASGRTGWYYRVLREGTVAPQDRMRRVHRADPRWTLARIWRVFYIDTLDRAELEALSRVEALAAGWREHAIRRLRTGAVEDWTRRLDG